MKIVVINTAASEGGAISVLLDFYNYLIKSNDKNEWIFILSDLYIKETKNIKVIVNKKAKSNWINRLKWEFYEGKNFINNLNPDIVFSMQNTLSKGIKGATAIYLHQSIPFQEVKKFSFFHKKERKLAFYQYVIGYIIKKSLKRTDKVIVQTNWIKKAIINSIKIDSERICKISPTINNIEVEVREDYLKEKIFFYPASAAIYKNHECIIEAVKKLNNQGIDNFKVVLTLKSNYREILNVNKEIEDKIIFLGHISRHEVIEMYRKSVLIFPSYIETFGLPLLEAYMVGSFILASECEFSKEILNEYNNVKYFDPFSSDELSELMKNIIIGECDYESNTKPQKQDNNCGWKSVVNEVLSIAKM